MKLAIFSFLLIGAALAAPAEPSWKLNRRDGNDTNATVPSAGGLAGRGHAKLPVWKRFENNTASSQGNVARNENRTVSVSVTLKERQREMSTKREANFPKFGAY